MNIVTFKINHREIILTEETITYFICFIADCRLDNVTNIANYNIYTFIEVLAYCIDKNNKIKQEIK